MSLYFTIQTYKKNCLQFSVSLICMFVLLLSASPVISDEVQGKVVLIAASGSNIDAMSHRNLRRLYLGLKSTENKSIRKPVLNQNSAELYDEFLKNIMHMTAGSYKRKLVKAVFRQGREEIAEVRSLVELNNHLLEHRGDVSFIEITSIEKMENIEVVQVLW